MNHLFLMPVITTATVRLPVGTKRRLAAAAKRRGVSLSRYLVDSAEYAASVATKDLPVSPLALEIEQRVQPENLIPNEA